MQTSSKYLLIGALLIFGFVSQAHPADKSIADATANPEKVAKKVWFGPPPGQIKKLYEIGMPKRIGLISFYIYDTGSHEFSALNATYGGRYFESIGLKEWVANEFASEFAELQKHYDKGAP